MPGRKALVPLPPSAPLKGGFFDILSNHVPETNKSTLLQKCGCNRFADIGSGSGYERRLAL